MKAKLLEKYYQLTKSVERFVLRFTLAYSRLNARRLRKVYVRNAGKSVLNRPIRRSIKEYAKKRFGSKAYWPYLALYTEVRGAFVEGWIPFDYFSYVLEPKLNPPVYRELGNQKSFNCRRFGDFALKPLFFSISGLFYDSDFELMEEGKLKDFLAAYNNNIVVKQEFGEGDEQLRLMHSSEFKTELLEPGKNYVIRPHIKQYKMLQDLYPDSMNTFRLTTFLKKDASVEIVYTILRFGRDGSKVDNLDCGGHCIEIDIHGKPAPIAYDNCGVEGGERHKNTGYRFADLEIPMFPEIIAKCKAAHKSYPFVRLIGWDVCLNEAGEPKLIDWITERPRFTMEDALYGPFFPDDSEF